MTGVQTCALPIWSSAFTYTQDTQASAPTINGLTLINLPPNFINHQESVTFTGTGEPGAYVTVNWTSKDGGGRDVVKTFHAEVLTNGSWSLSVSKADFPPDTARLSYGSTVTASQIDPSGNASSSSAPLSLALNTALATITASITTLTDANVSSVSSGSPLANNYYSVNATGVIAPGETTDEHKPLLSGTLSDALPAVQRADMSDQVVVRVYDGNVYLGNAAVNGQAWTYQVASALTDGAHNFSVDVYDPLTLQTSVRSDSYGMNSNVLTLTPFDTTPGHAANWVITTTAKPTFQGTLDRKSTRLNSSHIPLSRMPSSA